MDNATPAFKTVTAERGWAWLVEGFALFQRNPGVWIGICIIWVLAAMVVALLPLGSQINTVFTPVLFGGLMLGCADANRGEDFEIGHLFAGFQKQLVPLLLVGLALMAVELVIGVIITMLAGVFGLTALFGALAGGSLNSALGAGAATASLGVGLFVVMAVALVLYTVVLLAMNFAPTLVALGKVQPLPALQGSVMATLANWAAFTVYGLITVLLFIVACIPFGLGLLVLIPVLICASYVAYRDVYADLPEQRTEDD